MWIRVTALQSSRHPAVSTTAKLERGREACRELKQDDLSETLREASEALSELDLGTYRKRLATVIARLGHVR